MNKKQKKYIIVFSFIVASVAIYEFYCYEKQSTCTPTISFYFVRHGQTDGNVKGLMQGTTDTPLNETGIEQAHAAAQLLKNYDIATIVSSPLKRAPVTAEIIGQVLDKPVIILDELKEQCAGVMENEPSGSWIGYWDKGKIIIPNAETWQEFNQRIRAALCKALELPGPVLIVGHGRIGVLLGRMLLPKDTPFCIKNAIPLFFKAPQITEEPWLLEILT